MRDHDDDDVGADGRPPAPEPLYDDSTAADEPGRQLVRDRMLGLWRAAVQCVARVEQAREAREAPEPPEADPPTSTWRLTGAPSN